MATAQTTRLAELQARMSDAGLDLFVIQDPDSIAVFAGFWNHLGMEFGRATLLVVPRAGAPVLITPAMEAEMARAMTWITDIRPWADGLDGEWVAVLETLVAVAMGEAGRAAIGEGVPEYEVALAVIAAGTRKAAEFLAAEPQGSMAAAFTSPTIHNLQIMQSGHDTCMVHRRSTVRTIRRGDPVYLCFCGIANFKQFKLGFDREYFVGSVTDAQARAYETTLGAQQAALAELRPGAIAEEVHRAAEEVYRSAGYGAAYRTGRAFGYSSLEEPQLKTGDTTRIEPGMAFAVDGGITIEGDFGTRVGDSVVVTEDGFEYLTDFPRELTVL